jgi:hypothetical protein
MNDAEEHLMTVFTAALDCGSAAERQAYLDRACAGDPALRHRVEALLRAHERAGGFLGAPGPERTVGLSRAASVLKELDRAVGRVPRVMLRDTETEPETPVVRPSPGAVPVEPSSRYLLLGEIARGGMGAILKGRDTDLGRDLALKVLLDRHCDHPELVRRFVEEAQIGGQLQHPGIAPVYELGTFPDKRPFFTMKLVKGRTLAALLESRRAPADD